MSEKPDQSQTQSILCQTSRETPRVPGYLSDLIQNLIHRYGNPTRNVIRGPDILMSCRDPNSSSRRLDGFRDTDGLTSSEPRITSQATTRHSPPQLIPVSHCSQHPSQWAKSPTRTGPPHTTTPHCNDQSPYSAPLLRPHTPDTLRAGRQRPLWGRRRSDQPTRPI